MHKEADAFKVTLFGSLAQTGMGHGTDLVIKKTFSPKKVDIEFDYLTKESKHPNTMEMFAYKDNKLIDHRKAYSVGGGTVIIDGVDLIEDKTVYQFASFKEISSYCNERKMRLWEYILQEEGNDVWLFLGEVWSQMKKSIRNGQEDEWTLPGGLNVKKKAKVLYQHHHIDETEETKQNCLCICICCK